MDKKKKDTGYRVALTSVKSILRLLIYICGIFLIVYLGKSAYDFGYDLLNQKPVAATEAKGQDVTVIIRDGTSTYAIGKLLKEKGLIHESPAVFWVQVRLSNYYGKLENGSYILNTHQTVDEMLAILAKENTEGQPTFEEDGMDSDVGASGKGSINHVMEGTEEGGE